MWIKAAQAICCASRLWRWGDQGLDAFGERFAAAGFAVLAFDYRHFGDSTGEPHSLFHAGRQREDWRAALTFARSLDRVDAARVAIWGFSMGGGHVQSLAMTEPGIGAAICIAPLVDGGRTLLYVGGIRHGLRLGVAGLRDCLKAVRGAEPHKIRVAGPPGSTAVLNSQGSAAGFASVTSVDSTWRNEVCARAVLAPPYRLTRGSRRIACPILYCVAEDDDINPPKLGKRAAQRAPKGELRLYPGGHFDPFLGENLDRMAADQVEFLSRHLGSTA